MLLKVACEARWELSPQLLGSPSGSAEAALSPGAEQSQGLRISGARSPAAATAPAPRTCSPRPGNGGAAHLSGGNPETKQSNQPGRRDDFKSRALGDGPSAGEHYRPEPKADNSLKGSPWVMKAMPAGRGSPARPGVPVQTLRPAANRETHSASLLAPLPPNVSVSPSAFACPEASTFQDASTPRICVLTCKGAHYAYEAGR